MSFQIPSTWKLAKSALVRSTISRILDTTIDFLLSRYSALPKYKATQVLPVSTLRRKFGADSTIFINGNERLRFPGEHGAESQEAVRRHQAAEAFRKGKVRFLVSTEAAGEGIDLQDNCHVFFMLPCRGTRCGRISASAACIASARNSPCMSTARGRPPYVFQDTEGMDFLSCAFERRSLVHAGAKGMGKGAGSS